MPRLSIIVPHRQNDARLEMTLLSVLENRPEECEIIVVHNGSYTNPYDLQDEVIFVEEERQAGSLQLLNAGVMAACSPAVCVLLDGAVVTPGWSDSPLETLLSSESAAVAVGVDYPKAKRTACGVAASLASRLSAVQAGRLDAARPQDECIGPVLACGFYRRKVLLSVGGWNEELDESIADVELALTCAALGLHCQVDSVVRVASNCGNSPRKLSRTATSQLASLLAAHGAVATGWLPALQSLFSGCLRGSLVGATAWSAGLRDASTIRRTQLRLNHAKQQIASSSESALLRVYDGELSQRPGLLRRAA